MTATALFTDLYELTMLDAYHSLSMDDVAVFSLFVRKLPPERNFLVACGVEELLDDIEELRFHEDDIAHLVSLGRFRPEFLDWLRSFRFSGEIFAVAEGTPVFANEPILEVIAPIAEGQLLETLILNQIGFQTVIASKAARIVEAANGRAVVDFGSRRAHGMDAAIKGARAAYLAGVSATSNVEAGRRYGIPVAGTVAHSFVQAFPNEMESFRRLSERFPETTLLVDTYDTIVGVRTVVNLARKMKSAFKVRAIRLDSGDLLELSRESRRLLDEGGLQHVKIFASGGLDEWSIEGLLRAGAPIDAFGVGTDMMVSPDAAALDIAYKLTEYAGIGRMKLSANKVTLPGRKQAFRHIRNGAAVGDTIGRGYEDLSGRRLLEPVMTEGRRMRACKSLATIADETRMLIRELPPHLRALKHAALAYPIHISSELADYEAQTRRRLTASKR
ncbi:nicotinate phosphoribosyltransferase [Ensifer sp. IC3342]|nr:nicotinate phosphoribosyltransferase [Ensifer sp. BRP08]MCA1450841.1 nicotinate phosphoribosyltransferase [Ensifer sp. IC3342]